MAKAVWTRDNVVEVLRQWDAEGGDMRILSYREWKRGRDAPADVTIAKLFGSWRELVRAAGFEPVGRPGFDVRPALREGVPLDDFFPGDT